MLTRKNHEFVVPETESALIAHCEKQTAAEECLRERVDICDTGITKVSESEIRLFIKKCSAGYFSRVKLDNLRCPLSKLVV